MYRGLLAGLFAALTVAGQASALESPPRCPRPIPKWDGGSTRVVPGTSGAGKTADSYLAILPEGYRSDRRRRYPVVYLLHGAESVAEEYLRCMRLIELMAADRVIVVLPQGTPSGFWIDWHNGEQLRESALLEMIDAVDRRFRTIPDRSGRAIAGLSMGGYGAMVQAARHPELYSAAASFSGALDSAASTAGKGEFVYAIESALAPGAFADPVTPQGREWRAAHDPASIADRLRGKWLFLASGNGVPCDQDETERLGELDPTGPTFEPLMRADHDRLAAALAMAGIPHVSRRYECGAHTFRTFQRALEEAWPDLTAAIGARPALRLRAEPTWVRARRRSTIRFTATLGRRPAAGVRIALAHWALRTGSDGIATIRFAPRQPGLYMAVARSGSQTARASIRAVRRPRQNMPPASPESGD